MKKAIYEGEIPFLSTEQMVEVDRLMIEVYGIGLLQMMENAGRALARLAVERFLHQEGNARSATVLSGIGGNGGGGLVAARRLHGWGVNVQVFLSSPADKLGEVPAHQLRILQNMGVSVKEPDGGVALPLSDLIIDALIGYSLRGAPVGTAAALINAANSHAAPVLSLDVPSGVDTSTGVVHEPSIRSTATLTLALPKDGLRSPEARSQVGELYLADISVPPSLYAETSLWIEVGPIFSRDEIIRVW